MKDPEESNFDTPEFDNPSDLINFLFETARDNKHVLNREYNLFMVASIEDEDKGGIQSLSLATVTSIPGFCAMHFKNTIEPTLQEKGDEQQGDFTDMMREMLRRRLKERRSGNDGDRPSITNE